MVTEENMETTITLSPKHGPIVNGDMDNVVHNDASRLDETHDELALMVMELVFQNDYLKAQIGGDGPKTFRVEEASREDYKGEVYGLYEKVKTLEKEIQEQKETQKAADDALEHLRVVYTEADQKVQELSVKIVEAQHKTEQEIKERDDKYVELDTKFGRLHKRAKQRIQELQKEKDDIEVRLHDVNMKAEQASTQQTLTQQDLERVRQQANEALRLMDVERQQLKTTNNKLRDDIDKLRHSLEAKANVLEGLEQTIFEKDRMLEETRRTLQNAEEKRQTTITEVTELSSKYEKQLECLGAELADAISERSKAAETISSLQIMLREKDTKIIELDAASTNEAVRLRAALDEARAELGQQKVKHENERQSWEAACEALRIKLEASESTSLRSQIETAKLRSQLELELSKQNQLLNTRDTELLAAKNEIRRVESEFSAYKTRAHALLQKKDAEIVAAKDSEFLRAQEEKVKEAEREVLMALTERDKAIQDLQDMLSNHEKEITARELALKETEQRIQSITMKLESATTLHLSEKDAWQKNLDSVEENWRLKYGMLEAQNMVHTGRDLQKDMEVLKLRYEKLKEEHDAFRDIADRMIEEKEKEINKFIEENKNLHRSLELRPSVDHNDRQNSASLQHDLKMLSIASAEQDILVLARQQAQREEELAQSQRHILALQVEIEELERENRLHNQQEAMLKAELRNVERSQKREGIDMTYLKNVILKLVETGEVEALLPVIGTLLQFSPEEVRKCQQAYHSSDSTLSPAASLSDAATTPRSLFSRFSFS